MGKPARRDRSTGLKKRPWTAEEDQRLLHYIHKHGRGKWRTVPNNAGLQRCGKSCRLRWTNYLRPGIRRGRFSVEEEDTIIQLHSVLGNKWSLIASRLPGRTDNEIKNYWNTHIRKRLLKQGIDPVTHNLRLDLLQLCSFLNSSSSLCISPQPNMQSLLDIQNVMNIIPSLQNYPEFMHDDNQFINFPQVQCQYQPFQEFPAGTSSTTSNASSLNTGNMEQFSLSFNFSSKNYAPSLCPNINISNDHQSNYMGQSLAYPSGVGCIHENPSGVELLWADQNQIFQFNNVNAKEFEFGSVISTSSAGASYLNSSTTHVNGRGTEDEKDTFCNNNKVFDTPYDVGF